MAVAGVSLALCGAAVGCSSTSPVLGATDETEASSEDTVSSKLGVVAQAEATPATTEPDGADVYRFVLWSRSYRELLVDGLNVYDSNIESYRRRMTGYVDVEDDYFYFLNEGVADVTGHACGEVLLIDGAEYARDTSAPGNELDFRLADVRTFPAGAIDSVFVDAFVPSSAVLFFQRAGLTAPEPDAEGTRRLALDSEQILALFDVGGMPGTAESPMPDAVETSGTFETVEDEDGRLLRVRVDLVESGPVAQNSNGSSVQRVWKTTGILSVELLALDTPPYDLSSPRPEEGYCEDITADVPGSWKTRQAEDAYFSIDGAGAISGYAACQTFTGTSEFSHNWLVNVELEIEGEQCSDGTYVGRKLIALLESDPGVWRYGDILAVFEAEGESYFFEPS